MNILLFKKVLRIKNRFVKKVIRIFYDIKYNIFFRVNSDYMKLIIFIVFF